MGKSTISTGPFPEASWPGEPLAVLVLDVHVDGGDWGDGRLPEAPDTLTVGGRGGPGEPWKNHGKTVQKVMEHMGNRGFRQGILMVCY